MSETPHVPSASSGSSDIAEVWRALDTAVTSVETYAAFRRIFERAEKAEVDLRVEQEQNRWFVEALNAIEGPEDSGPFIEPYQAAGGGYEGLQAIARYARLADTSAALEGTSDA
jgi:hypothetical protein